MKIDDVCLILKETDEAIACLKNIGIKIPPEAYQIKELCELGIKQHKTIEDLENEVEDLKQKYIWTMEKRNSDGGD